MAEPARLRRARRLAALVLWWERVWPALWPVVGLIGLFVVLAVAGVLAALPGTLHLVVLVVGAVAVAALLLRAGRHTAWPDRHAALRRLERDSALDHRPLTGLGDRIAGGAQDPATTRLWAAHRRRMVRALRRLRLTAPRPDMSRADPIALRAALFLGLVVALVAAGERAGPRLIAALSPNPGTGVPVDWSVWVTPPAHTGVAPLFLAPDNPGPLTLTVPAGSVAATRLHGAESGALLLPDATVDLTPLAADGLTGEGAITESGTLAVAAEGDELAAWALAVQPDLVPDIAFPAPPVATDRHALRVDYVARDDYGLTDVAAVIARDGDTVRRDLPLPARAPTQVEAAGLLDLTAHPWAGLAVDVTLEARDAAGQTGTAGPIAVTLPERPFHHPVARAIIAARKDLAARAAARWPVADRLGAIAGDPAAFDDDLAVFLALKVAERRLKLNEDAASRQQVIDLMWETALRVEEGPVAGAEQELRAAMDALAEALARQAPEAEIQALMDRVDAALDDYLRALAAQAAAEGTTLPEDLPATRIRQADDLRDLLDQARELSRTGAREAARQTLGQLQHMLENMRMGMAPTGEMSRDQQALQDLQDLVARQQALMDRSFQRGQIGAAPDPEGRAADAAAQDRLRQELADLMAEMGAQGTLPESLGAAEQAMGAATEALEGGRPGAAADPQGRAVAALRGAMAETVQRMMARGMEIMRMGGSAGGGQDPLGRPRGAPMTDGPLPDTDALQRAREILDELRRRAGDRQRPELERDYLERLMDFF